MHILATSTTEVAVCNKPVCGCSLATRDVRPELSQHSEQRLEIPVSVSSICCCYASLVFCMLSTPQHFVRVAAGTADGCMCVYRVYFRTMALDV